MNYLAIVFISFLSIYFDVSLKFKSPCKHPSLLVLPDHFTTRLYTAYQSLLSPPFTLAANQSLPIDLQIPVAGALTSEVAMCVGGPNS